MNNSISFKLEIFEGPLDLLLHLISKNKVSINDIPIVQITEQYMEYLQKMKEFDLEIASEFLVLAANLLYIKSKTLLPKEKNDEEDPRLDLAQRLIEYKKIKSAALLLEDKYLNGPYRCFKPMDNVEPILVDETYKNVTLESIMMAYISVFNKIEKRLPPKKSNFAGIIGHEIVSVVSKVKDVLKTLKAVSKINFKEIFTKVKSRSEAVASFLAILELMKLNRINVIDDKKDVFIEYSAENDADD